MPMAPGRYGQALPLQLSNEPVDPALQPPEAAHGELTLRWQAGSEGQRYRVQVDRRGDFKAPWSTKPWPSRRSASSARGRHPARARAVHRR
jgi:hypothetical protein